MSRGSNDRAAREVLDESERRDRERVQREAQATAAKRAAERAAQKEKECNG